MHRARDEHLGAIAEEKVKAKSEIQCNKNTDCITVVQLKGFRSRELRKVKSSITGGCCGDVHLCSLKQEKFAKLCNHHHYHHHINIAIMMIIIIITAIITIIIICVRMHFKTVKVGSPLCIKPCFALLLRPFSNQLHLQGVPKSCHQNFEGSVESPYSWAKVA